MGLFDIFKKKQTENASSKPALVQLGQDKIEQLVSHLRRNDGTPAFFIKAHKGNTTLTDSKFGGYPYWEKGREYPANKEGKPLCLLCQINLSDLPPSSLPECGLLQFFIDTDDLMGLPYKGDRSGYRVIYYPEIKGCLSVGELKNMGIDSFENRKDESAPFYETYTLKFETSIDHPGFYDDTVVISQINEMFQLDLKNEIPLHRQITREDYNTFYTLVNSSGHKILGYPYFTQSDPRENGEYSVLLLQIDSDSTKDSGNSILWGDYGVANFFISDKDLKEKNFDSVLFNWDCY